ncbi:hypothetical protein ADUPG1_014225 [Aduncisulcus paluster]|uniref:ARM repeat superfamily protein n=2 Tax=Aduncisulcus paluster TaxID=2918883 RepID=A0ABQ5KB90_9EUKA|nr:hypothetical protein ADUPG1_014225 [Aduncisulcus paluster]
MDQVDISLEYDRLTDELKAMDSDAEKVDESFLLNIIKKSIEATLSPNWHLNMLVCVAAEYIFDHGKFYVDFSKELTSEFEKTMGDFLKIIFSRIFFGKREVRDSASHAMSSALKHLGYGALDHVKFIGFLRDPALRIIDDGMLQAGVSAWEGFEGVAMACGYIGREAALSSISTDVKLNERRSSLINASAECIAALAEYEDGFYGSYVRQQAARAACRIISTGRSGICITDVVTELSLLLGDSVIGVRREAAKLIATCELALCQQAKSAGVESPPSLSSVISRYSDIALSYKTANGEWVHAHGYASVSREVCDIVTKEHAKAQSEGKAIASTVLGDIDGCIPHILELFSCEFISKVKSETPEYVNSEALRASVILLPLISDNELFDSVLDHVKHTLKASKAVMYDAALQCILSLPSSYFSPSDSSRGPNEAWLADTFFSLSILSHHCAMPIKIGSKVAMSRYSSLSLKQGSSIPFIRRCVSFCISAGQVSKDSDMRDAAFACCVECLDMMSELVSSSSVEDLEKCVSYLGGYVEILTKAMLKAGESDYVIAAAARSLASLFLFLSQAHIFTPTLPTLLPRLLPALCSLRSLLFGFPADAVTKGVMEALGKMSRIYPSIVEGIQHTVLTVFRALCIGTLMSRIVCVDPVAVKHASASMCRYVCDPEGFCGCADSLSTIRSITPFFYLTCSELYERVSSISGYDWSCLKEVGESEEGQDLVDAYSLCACAGFMFSVYPYALNDLSSESFTSTGEDESSHSSLPALLTSIFFADSLRDDMAPLYTLSALCVLMLTVCEGKKGLDGKWEEIRVEWSKPDIRDKLEDGIVGFELAKLILDSLLDPSCPPSFLSSSTITSASLSFSKDEIPGDYHLDHCWSTIIPLLPSFQSWLESLFSCVEVGEDYVNIFSFLQSNLSDVLSEDIETDSLMDIIVDPMKAGFNPVMKAYRSIISGVLQSTKEPLPSHKALVECLIMSYNALTCRVSRMELEGAGVVCFNSMWRECVRISSSSSDFVEGTTGIELSPFVQMLIDSLYDDNMSENNVLQVLGVASDVFRVSRAKFPSQSGIDSSASDYVPGNREGELKFGGERK